MTCDSKFYKLLNLDASLKRPTSAATKNEYGEVILDESAPVIATFKTRLDPSVGKKGLSVEIQGKTVFIECKAFICPQIDILPNDVLEINSRDYLVLRIDEYYNNVSLHHKEVLLKRTDLL